MKKILVTGASGFIGSFLAEGALSRGFDTWAGIRATSSRGYLQDSRLHFIDLPYDNLWKLKEVLSRFKAQNGGWDYIIHNAGLTQSVYNEEFFHVNYQNTRNFVETLIELKMVPERFIFMSSLSVFGPVEEKSMQPIRLTDTPAPNTVYGKSKLKAEEFFAGLTHFPVVILRPTAVYGPRDKDYFLLTKTVRSGLDVSVGYKPQKITFIYVKDLVCAVYLAIEKAKPHSSYFVSDGEVYTSSDYAQFVKQKMKVNYLLSLRIPLCLVWLISASVGRLMQWMGRSFTLNSDKFKIMKQRNWCCDNQPAEQDLGFKAEYKLQQGVEESIDWYQANGWL